MKDIYIHVLHKQKQGKEVAQTAPSGPDKVLSTRVYNPDTKIKEKNLISVVWWFVCFLFPERSCCDSQPDTYSWLAYGKFTAGEDPTMLEAQPLLNLPDKFWFYVLKPQKRNEYALI